MQKFLKKAEKILEPENLLVSAADITDYAVWPTFNSFQKDPLPPIAVAKPVNLTQAAELLKLCAETGIGCRLRGGGTRWEKVYPKSPYIVLTTVSLNRILDFDWENRQVCLQAGVTISQLAETCAQKDLFFPTDPTCGDSATIGGIIALNPSTPVAAKYGPVCSYIQALDIITPIGERFMGYGQNIHPGSLIPAFPLAQLFCGSCGCLGLIGSAVVNLLPMPKFSQSLAAVFPDQDKAAQAAQAINRELMPDMLDFLNGLAASLLTSSDMGNKSMILLKFSGDAADADLAIAREILSANGVREIMDCDTWLLQNRQSLPAIAASLNKDLWPAAFCCPPNRFGALVENISTIAADLGMAPVIFGSAAIARINILLVGDQEKAQLAIKKIFDVSLTLNGCLDSEADLDLGHKTWATSRHPELIKLSNKIRQIFDPTGILTVNPLPGEDYTC